MTKDGMVLMTTVDPAALAWRELNDSGNADRFVARAGGLLVHVRGLEWVAYDGARWSAEDGGRLAQLKAMEVARGMRDEIEALADMAGSRDPLPAWLTAEMLEERILSLRKHAVTSGNAPKTKAMLDQAAALPDLNRHRDDFDCDPLTINTANRTLRFVEQGGFWGLIDAPHDPADLLTRVCATDWEPRATNAAWAAHMEAVLPDPDVRWFFQKLMGYVATGKTEEQIFILLQGKGGDGKSTVINVLRTVLGDYAVVGNVNPELEGQFTLLLRSFANAIGAAAGPLGEATGAVEARLSGFVVNIGKIDLKGLTGEQIADKLTSIFGKAADEMADAAFPGISRFQKVGEGAFETLVRVASTVEAVTGSLDQLGLSARALGIDAKVGIASQFDSLSAMTSATDAYFKAFYTPAEQNAARMSQLSGVFVRLGVTMPATIGAFRSLVEAQDLTTAAGQSTYATLLQLAPAFAELKGAMDGAKSAADVIAEREGLQRRLLELEGNTTAIRALELGKLDASNRALQQQIYAIEDAKEAARAAEDLREAWASVGDGIAEEIKRIRGIDSVGGGGFAALLSDFNRANDAARGGDIDAAKTLPGLSQALLKAAADQATSRQELARIQAQTAAALEATQAAIAGRSAAQTTAAILANSAAAANANAPVSNTTNNAATDRIDRLEQENTAMRDTMTATLADIAASVRRTARTLDAVTSASGGEAITVATAA